MGRILFFLVLIIVMAVAWAISRRRNSLSNEERVELEAFRKAERERGRRSAKAIGEPMEKCEHCGVFFPRREAVHSGEHVYCSARCRDAAEREAR